MRAGKVLPLAFEVSVLIARGADGASAVYPLAQNMHRDGILSHDRRARRPTCPPRSSQQAQARRAARSPTKLGYVGVLCIEFFVLDDGSLVANEMAPRPHNSGHYTIDACATSQFEQQVRAMTGMPLGDTRQHSPAVDAEHSRRRLVRRPEARGRTPPWHEVAAMPAARLHLYGKEEARRGRKMGHVNFTAATLEEARTAGARLRAAAAHPASS